MQIAFTHSTSIEQPRLVTKKRGRPAGSKNKNRLTRDQSAFEYEIDNLRFHKKKMNYEKVMEYYKSFYIPSRFVLSIVTNTPFETIKSMVKKSYFMKNVLPTNQYILNRNIQFHIEPQNKMQYLLQKKVGIVTNLLMIGFRTCNDLSDDNDLFDIIDDVDLFDDFPFN